MYPWIDPSWSLISTQSALHAESSRNDDCCSCIARIIRYGIYAPGSSGSAVLAIPTFTSCPACHAGKLRSTKPYSSVKIAVFAPIPSASVSTAMIVSTGFFRCIRNPNRKSAAKSSSLLQIHASGAFSFTDVTVSDSL
jgi:hypothetical protein